MLSISQEQYVETILEQHRMAACSPCKTPMGMNLQLPLLTEPEVNVQDYQRYIGSLMYLMVCTRPDIAYSVGVLSRHVTCPGKPHLQAVKRVFRYLHSISHYKLEFRGNSFTGSPFISYVDSDWAGDCSDKKSISGYAILMDGGAVSWGSKKQSCVALSTVESEFIAALAVVKEVIWMRLLFNSLVMPLTDPIRILIDNQGVLDLIKSGQINDRTKHIETLKGAKGGLAATSKM